MGNALDEGSGGGASQSRRQSCFCLVAGQDVQPAQQHAATVSHHLRPCAHLPTGAAPLDRID